MLMKVHNKGQVVIPAEIRKVLDLEIGDFLEVEIDAGNQRILLHKSGGKNTRDLAGSLSQYANNKTFPSKQQMRRALQQGLSRDG
ncbi:MAG: AbrB/MazE/SpoVT family DNA-binding domain-containing protein [Candidatus Latescibacteria bacterium]|nr:AbrB/MazE/SpoVT family DNA-binding domain-containing protein [Candidatus Latescibacterota bacterium]